jgi:hypothetical protein
VVEGFVSVFADIFMGLLQVIIEIILASIRPWRYLMSRKYRAQLDMQYAESPIIKYFHLLWGSLLVLTSILIVVWLLWFFVIKPQPAPDPNAVQKLEHMVIDEIIKHNESGQ